MSSFKNFAPTLRSLQAQADGTGTIAGSPLEDFLSIAGYETPGGGGGGSSDFSTATVTITNTAEQYYTIVCPNIYDGKMYSDINKGDLPDDFEIVLYKGQCRLIVSGYDEATLAVTGNIEAELGGSALITGNGTITIS